MANVYVVHCVDTEGPLHESLVATFNRIKDASGLEIEPTYHNLEAIQEKKISLGGFEDVLAMAFSKRLLSYNDDWNSIYDMLDRITNDDYRKKFVDSFGNGWKFTWFILDLAEFYSNPRGKTLGYNAIYDRYNEYYELHDIKIDEFQFHAHPMSIYKEANRCGTSFINSPHILQSLARRLIERGSFPEAYRAGFHTERADMNWFLEQYIPYDFSNQAIELTEDDKKQKDLSAGRFGDWRRADSSWAWYHPSHDDYQIKGNCHRTVFRCLNVGTRIRLLNQEEVNKAFRRAYGGEDTILAFTDHDFREMTYDIEEVYSYIKKASELYPKVTWINTTASEAAKKCLKETRKEFELDTNMEIGKNYYRLYVKCNIDSFGSQPFFAVKTKDKTFRVENLDIQKSNREWTYTFDADSLLPNDIEYIGLASNSRVGSGALKVIDLNNNVYKSNNW